MKLFFTEQAIYGLEESLYFLMEMEGLPLEKVVSIRTRLFNRADSLIKNPLKGQKEEYLKHLNQNHRRIIEGHFKIIYKIEGDIIYITDFFDSRQNPVKMKG